MITVTDLKNKKLSRYGSLKEGDTFLTDLPGSKNSGLFIKVSDGDCVPLVPLKEGTPRGGMTRFGYDKLVEIVDLEVTVIRKN